MIIYLKWSQTVKDTADRFIANLFSSLSKKWYPVNIVGSTLYDLLSMYGTEFSSGSTEITQVSNDLALETVRSGYISGHENSKMYENFGLLVGTNKLPYQEFGQFNTGSLLNGYRSTIKFLNASHLEGMTLDAISRVGQAYTGVSPVAIEFVDNYPGWVLTNYTGSVVLSITLTGEPQQYVYVTPSFGRFGNTLPVTGSVYEADSTVNLSYSVLDINTVVYDEAFYRNGTLLYFFLPSGSAEYTTAVRSSIETAVRRVLPAQSRVEFEYSQDYVSWRPVAPSTDTMVVSSSVFAVSPLGWVYNATPTPISGSVYITDVIQIP